MSEVDLLMTDEFVEFSKAIAEAHEKKKSLEAEFKKHFDEYKAAKKAIEDKVSEANSTWENWKKSQSGIKKDK